MKSEFLYRLFRSWAEYLKPVPERPYPSWQDDVLRLSDIEEQRGMTIAVVKIPASLFHKGNKLCNSLDPYSCKFVSRRGNCFDVNIWDGTEIKFLFKET